MHKCSVAQETLPAKTSYDWNNAKYPINAEFSCGDSAKSKRVIVMFIAKNIGIVVESNNQFLPVGMIHTNWYMENMFPCVVGTSFTITVTNE